MRRSKPDLICLQYLAIYLKTSENGFYCNNVYIYNYLIARGFILIIINGLMCMGMRACAAQEAAIAVT